MQRAEARLTRKSMWKKAAPPATPDSVSSAAPDGVSSAVTKLEFKLDAAAMSGRKVAARVATPGTPGGGQPYNRYLSRFAHLSLTELKLVCEYF